MLNNFAFFLFLFSLGAFLMPLVSRAIRIPIIVGEIIYGMLLSALFYTDKVDMSFIDQLANFGFVFLMFLAGMELNFENFAARVLIRPVIAVILFILTAMFLSVRQILPDNIYLVLIISASSVGVAFIALKSANMEKTWFGQQIIWTLTLGEMVTILGMMVYELFHGRTASDLSVFLDIGKLVLLFLLAFTFLRLIIFLFWRFPSIAYLIEEKEGTAETGVRLSFMLLLTMLAITSFFDLELILGAFLGGMMISFVFRDKTIFEEKLSTIGYGFFTPFFFIKLGWDFRLESSEISAVVLKALSFYGLIVLVKIPSSVVFLKSGGRMNFSQKIKTMASAIMLWSAPLTLLVALARLGRDIGLIGTTEYHSLVLCAMISGLINPVVFSLVKPRLTAQNN